MSAFNFTVQTDKLPGGWHAAYMAVYALLFDPLRHTSNSVLEIGTDGGACLLAYEEYFHNAMIVGMDINPAPDALRNRERIVHAQRDAYTLEAAQLLSIYEPFAVLIDDGSHFLENQKFFCANYARLLARDGLMILEDIQDPAHIPELAKALPAGMANMAIDLRHVNGRYDDLILVAWRA